MNCRICQKPVQEGFKFCPYCGTEVNAIPACPSCKNEIKPDWNSCPYCGASLSHNKPQQPPVQNPFPPNHNEHGHGYGYGHHSGSSGRHRKKGFFGGFFSS